MNREVYVYCVDDLPKPINGIVTLESHTDYFMMRPVYCPYYIHTTYCHIVRFTDENT